VKRGLPSPRRVVSIFSAGGHLAVRANAVDLIFLILEGREGLELYSFPAIMGF